MASKRVLERDIQSQRHTQEYGGVSRGWRTCRISPLSAASGRVNAILVHLSVEPMSLETRSPQVSYGSQEERASHSPGPLWLVSLWCPTKEPLIVHICWPSTGSIWLWNPDPFLDFQFRLPHALCVCCCLQLMAENLSKNRGSLCCNTGDFKRKSVLPKTSLPFLPV